MSLLQIRDPNQLEDVQQTRKPEKKKDIFEMEEEDFVIPEDKVGWWSSVGRDVVKGTAEMLVGAGRVMGPLEDPQPSRVEAGFEEGVVSGLDKLEAAGESPDMSKVLQKIAESTMSNQQKEAQMSDLLDEWLPSDKTKTGDLIRGTAQTFGKQALFPGSSPLDMLARTFLGTAGKEAVKGFGGGETAQTAAEVIPHFLPGGGKKIQPKGEEERELIGYMRRAGLSEEEITPFLQGGKKKIPDWVPGIGGKEVPNKAQILGKLAKKGLRTESALAGSRKSFGKMYQHIKGNPQAAKPFTPTSANELRRGVQKAYSSLPNEVKEVIKKDYQKFLDGPLNTKSAVEFYQTTNHYFEKAPKLGAFKDPIKKAISTTDRQMARDFELTNSLYERYKGIESTLKTGKYHSIINAMENLGTKGMAVAGLHSGNAGFLIGAFGEVAARSIAQQMLINPRLQNLSLKALQAAEKGKYAIANQLTRRMAKSFEEESPEAAAALETFDWEDLKNF